MRLSCISATFGTAAMLRRNVVDSANGHIHVVDSVKSNVTMTADAQLGNIWVPITLPQQGLKYFNPATGQKSDAAPAGAVVTKEASVVGLNKQPTYNSGITYGKPGEQLLPDSVRNSCVPHCTWDCTQPVCEQNCEPVCHAGECETRCPKMDKDQLEKCNVQCSEPSCKMYCPKEDLCQGKKTLDCESRPKCQTRCDEPQCNFVCNNDLGDKCKTVCPDPVCTFKCKKPSECPKPVCNMVCEKPPNCDTKPTSEPLQPGEVVIGHTKASRADASWQSGEWGTCSATCGSGTQSRSVKCSSGHPEDCTRSKPEESRTCENYAGCEYAVGAWSACNGQCGTGTQTRRVNCAGKECHGKKPASEQQCSHDSPDCTNCKALVFGGPNFDGWSLEFTPGEYTVSDMEVKGAKCDDISSMKVLGYYCKTTVYEFGDFNGQHKGWMADFGPGSYTRQQLVDGGAKDNDISSLKVVKTSRPAGNSTGNPYYSNSANANSKSFNMTNSSNNPFGAANPFHSSAVSSGVFAVLAAAASRFF